MNLESNFKPNSNKDDKQHKVGDYLFNPITEQNVKITFLGNNVYRFSLKGKSSRQALFYEALEGSDHFKVLMNDPRFEGKLNNSEPSVELEWSTEIEYRRIVVPLKDLDKFQAPK